jgi:hypothetical protein
MATVATLIPDIQKVVEKLRQQYGAFRLAMLYNDDPDPARGWNLIVSAPWADQLGIAETTRRIAHELHLDLGFENRGTISRVTVLKTSDPFVRDMTNLYPASTPGDRLPIHPVTAGGVSEGSAYVFYSQSIDQ